MMGSLDPGDWDTDGTWLGLARKHISQLLELRRVNMTAVVVCGGVVRDPANGSALQHNWTANWDAYWALVSPHAAGILAFYPYDEPSPDLIASGPCQRPPPHTHTLSLSLSLFYSYSLSLTHTHTHTYIHARPHAPWFRI